MTLRTAFELSFLVDINIIFSWKSQLSYENRKKWENSEASAITATAKIKAKPIEFRVSQYLYEFKICPGKPIFGTSTSIYYIYIIYCFYVDEGSHKTGNMRDVKFYKFSLRNIIINNSSIVTN
jgi:hypothetical protein